MTVHIVDRPCATCQKPATYAGTQDSVRVYVCEDKHLTQVRVPGR